MCKWRECLTAIPKWFVLDDDVPMGSRYSLDQLALEAYAELRQAQELLNWVTEPDMVEYAVYSLKAAEKRCDYFLKKMREETSPYAGKMTIRS
jgi:vacuolar-type H+-ATPase subunit B/Vma2